MRTTNETPVAADMARTHWWADKRVLLAAAVTLVAVVGVLLATLPLGAPDAQAQIMEAMTEANGGVAPTLEYDGDQLVSIGGRFSAVRVATESDALSAVGEVAPLFGVYRSVTELEHVKTEERDDHTVVYWIAMHRGDDSGADSSNKTQDESSSGKQNSRSDEPLTTHEYLRVVADDEGDVSKVEYITLSEEEARELEREEPTNEDAYPFYAAKLEEYLSRYGEPQLVLSGSNLGVCAGVFLAQLLDFDNDGLDELLVAYYDTSLESNHQLESGNWDGSAYVIEVWGYDGIEVLQLHTQCAEWTNGGFTYLNEYRVESDTSDDSAQRIWIERFGDTADDGGFGRTLYELHDGSFEEVHRFSVVDEYTDHSYVLVDGVNTNIQNDAEWIDSFSEIVTGEYYGFIGQLVQEPKDITSNKRERITPDGCIQLAKETMNRLGIKAPETEETEVSAIDAEAIFAETLDSVKASADIFVGDTLSYQYADLDLDGVNELFIGFLSGPHSQRTCLIYKVEGGRAVKIFDTTERGGVFLRCYPENGTLVYAKSYKNMRFTWHYQYVDSTFVQRAAEFDARKYTGGYSCEGAEGVEVAEQEYGEIVAKMEIGDAVELPLDSDW